jgi:hypothetical protein
VFSLRPVLLAGIILAYAHRADAGGCAAGSADKVIQNTEIQAPSGVAALLQFGYEHGVCLGIEAPGPDQLQEPAQLHMVRSTARGVAQALVKAAPDQISQSISENQGVLLFRNPDSTSRFTQLDAVIPEFAIPVGSLEFAEMRLSAAISMYLDPSIKGFAGSLHQGPHFVGPIEEHERSARDLLTLIASQAGGAWIAGLCPAAPGAGSLLKCWTILPYDLSPEIFRARVAQRVAELLKERNSLK